MRKLFVRTGFGLLLLLTITACNTAWVWPKGQNGTALSCTGIVTDTRLPTDHPNYETMNVDMYGWTCIPPEYNQQLNNSAIDLDKELQKCKLDLRRSRR